MVIKKVKKLKSFGNLSGLFILIGCLGIFFWLTKNTSYRTTVNRQVIRQEASQTAQVASPSAIPTPTPEPIIPAPSGRSIRVPILTYHYIRVNPKPDDPAGDSLSVHPDNFEAQMSYLASSGFIPTDLDTFYAAMMGQTTLSGRPIILTFDDGYIDFYSIAYPILLRYHFRATVFIPTGLMNGSYYMSWDQLKDLNNSGIISIQAHSINHPNLTSLDLASVKHQLTESKQTLEALTGRKVNWMAYPYGISNLSVQQAAKQSGYVGSVGTWSGNLHYESQLYNLSRIKIGGSTDIETFKRLVN